MSPEVIADAYADAFPRRLQQAHMALLTYAEDANPDGWPMPRDVVRFAKLYGVKQAPLGGLVGLLVRRVNGCPTPVWIDALRHPEQASPYLIREHSREAIRAFGWFCATTDLGWVRLREVTLH